MLQACKYGLINIFLKADFKQELKELRELTANATSVTF